MPFILEKFQKYALPCGFVIILILMIGTMLLTAERVDKTSKTIISNQIESNNIYNLLDRMSDANLERSHIIFKLSHSTNKQLTEYYISWLYDESIKFNNARKKYVSSNLSPSEIKLLSTQAVLTIENIRSINEVIDFLEDGHYKDAAYLINTTVLPHNKSILTIIDKLYDVARTNVNTKIEETKSISGYTYKSIITISAISIVLSFLLMYYLMRKQKRNEQTLSILASTDSLTELPNRNSFVKKINDEILIAEEQNTEFSVVFLDIDYFKSINDMYGHEVGDEIINRFCQTIKDNITQVDVLSRFGGDEFVLLLKNKNHFQVRNILSKLSNALDTSYFIGANEIFVSASIGACSYPIDGQDHKELLKNADIAMYASKEAGRNCFQFYSISNSEKKDEENKISLALQTILKNNNKDKELSLVYQPLVNISDDQFYECEALIRWKDKDGNLQNTGKFIEIAEKSNLIEKVNMFVIEEVCKQQALWRKLGLPNVRVHINLSGNKRIFSNLFKYLSDNLKEYKLAPSLFGIELTERTIYEVSEKTTGDLEYFRSLGMKISIDDFGTGYSSLSYFKNLPITSVKIDRAFIIGVPNEKIDVALVKAIITLAHSLDFDVVAEGVETKEQFDFLKQYKCNIAQGYLLHHPMNPEDVFKLKLVA